MLKPEEMNKPIYKAGDILEPISEDDTKVKEMVIEISHEFDYNPAGVKTSQWIKYGLLIFWKNGRITVRHEVKESELTSTMRLVGHKEFADIFSTGSANSKNDDTTNLIVKYTRELYSRRYRERLRSIGRILKKEGFTEEKITEMLGDIYAQDLAVRNELNAAEEFDEYDPAKNQFMKDLENLRRVINGSLDIIGKSLRKNDDC